MKLLAACVGWISDLVFLLFLQPDDLRAMSGRQRENDPPSPHKKAP
jgi:hypothetical protein